MKENFKNAWLELFHYICFDDNISRNEQVQRIGKAVEDYKGKIDDPCQFPFGYEDGEIEMMIDDFNVLKGKREGSYEKKSPFEKWSEQLSGIMMNEYSREVFENMKKQQKEEIEENIGFIDRFFKKKEKTGGFTKT